MRTIKISATEARNRFFEMIEMVAYKGYPVVVQKNNKDFVRIIASGTKGNDFINFESLIKDTYGMCASGDWPYEKESVIEEEKNNNKNW